MKEVHMKQQMYAHDNIYLFVVIFRQILGRALDFETALPISNLLGMVQSGRYQPGIVSALVQLPPISKVAGILIPDCLV